MLMDYNAQTGAFYVRVGRSEGVDIQALIHQHGLNFSVTASDNREAILITHEPYAAAHFASVATPQAIEQLAGIVGNINSSWADHSDIRVDCPPDRELWDFQKADLAYALPRRNTLLADQPGLGKTPTAIVFANEIKAEHILVVCPANIRLQWAKRIREWTTLKWPYTVYPILKGGHGVHPSANWTVVSYDLARTEGIGKALSARAFDLLILDEAHYLKTIDTGRTRAIFGGGDNPLFSPIAPRCERILALTGTPLPNRPREAYTLARGLCFDAIDFMSEDRFRSRFNPSRTVEKEVKDTKGQVHIKRYIDERSGRHSELQNRLRANFMVRHLKRDVMTQLKLPIYDIVDMEETGPVKQALKAESLLGLDPTNLQGLDLFGGHVAVVRRQMGVALAPQVADYVEMLLDGGEDKIVVFAWHIEVLDILQRKLDKFGVLRIDGSTPARVKQERVEEFGRNPDIRVMIGNVLSLGTGTDGLQQSCSHAVFAEPDWVPGNNEQAVDRLDRGGQGRTVLADFCVAPKSIAANILKQALEKRETTHLALDAQLGRVHSSD